MKLLPAELRSLSRLVLEDVVDFVHNLGSEFRDDVERLEVIDDLFLLGSAEDAGRHVRVLDDPCSCKLAHRATELKPRKRSEGSYLLDLGLRLRRRKLLDGLSETLRVGGVSRVFRDVVIVLAGEHARVERGPDGGAHLLGLLEVAVFHPEFLGASWSTKHEE